MPAVAVVGHAAAAYLYEDILVLRDLCNAALPDFPDLRTPARVGSDAEGCTDVVQDDCHIRERAREVGEFAKLRVEEPCVECEVEPLKLREALAELGRHHDAGPLVAVGGYRGAGVVRSAVPYAAKSALAKLDVRLQHLRHRIAKRQVCVARYGGIDVRMHIGTRRRFFSNRHDELGLAEWLQALGAIGAVHGGAFEEDGADDVVAGP